jgi:GT2 family glycosyltransferase
MGNLFRAFSQKTKDGGSCMNSQPFDIGIVNYNGGEYLLRCVESLLAQKDISPAIHILDNNSSDGSLEKVKKRFPGCTIIQSSYNSGYAGGCNRLLRSMNSDIIAFCNMDLEFAPDWGKEILSCFNVHADVWSVASLVMEKESGSVYSSAVRFFWDLFPVSSRIPPASREPYEVASAYGAIMTFRKSLFDRIGLFDKDYFLFFEETEFYLRMQINGMKTVLCPSARVYHHRSLTTVWFSSTKLFYSERNRILAAFKYFPLWYFPLVLPLSVLRLMLMSRSGIPKKDGQGASISRFGIIRVLATAWCSALWYLPREWWKRNSLWKMARGDIHATFRILKKYRLPLRDLRLK